MAREQDRPIEILVRADVEPSVQQIIKDIGEIQKKLNGVNKEIFVNARIKKIEIDETAANYVKNELKKMFNTITVDIDGNVLGFGTGAATAVRKQADEIRKAISAAQKKLGNIQIDYGSNFTADDISKIEKFRQELERMANDLGSVVPSDVAIISDKMDVFAHAMLEAKKATAENAKELEKFANALQRADKMSQDIDQNYLDKANDDQKNRYASLTGKLASLRANPNATVYEINGVIDELEILRTGIRATAAESEKATKAANAHAAAMTKSLNAARLALDQIKAKNWDTMDDSQKQKYQDLANEIGKLRSSGNITEEAMARLTARIKVFGTETDKTASSVKAAAAASEKEAKVLQSALIAFDKAWASVERMDLGGLTDEQKKAYQEIKEIVELVNADRGGGSSSTIKEFTAVILRNKGNLQAMLADLKKVKAEAEKTRHMLTQLDGVEKTLSGIEEKFTLSLKPEDLAQIKTLRAEIEGLKDPTKLSAEELDKLKKKIDDFVTGIQTRYGRENTIASQINEIVTQIERMQNLGGDTHGLRLGSIDSVKSTLQEFKALVASLGNDLPAGTAAVMDEIIATFEATGKIDISKIREVARAFDAPQLATSDKYKQLIATLERLSIKAGQAADEVSDLHHTMSDNSRSQGFKNRINDDIRKLDEFYEKYTKLRNNKAFADEYQMIRSGFDLEASEEDIKKNEEAMKDYIHRAKQAGMTTDTLGEKIQRAYQKFGGWAIVSGSLMRVVSTIKDMINNVVALDKNLTELKKVTDETSDSYDAFMQRTKNTAKEIGATMNDVVSATADFARLGYSVEDAEELAKVALLYDNVGDGLDGIDEATSNIISTMQGFSIDSSEAMKLVDLMNAISNTESITSGGLGEALRRSSSAMAAAGNTLTQTMALITSANSVLQDPETVGKVSCPAA